MLDRCARLEDRYKGTENALTGPLKVVVPVGMGQDFLSDFAIEFQQRYTDVQLTWILQNEAVRFSETGCDLWLSLGDVKEKDLHRRKLALTQRCLVASEELVRKVHLQGPASVEKLPCVALNTKEDGVIELTSKTNHASITIYPTVVFSTNNFFALHTALLRGLGFGVLPRWFAQKDRNGKIIQLEPSQIQRKFDTITFAFL